MLVTPVIRDPFDPPAKRMPAPPNPLIVRASARGENTTLCTFAPITKPFAPGAVPDPSSVSPPPKSTLRACASVMPCRGSQLPTSPAIVIAPPAESCSLAVPSIVDEKEMSPPA